MNFTAIPWNNYFDNEATIKLPQGEFHYYIKGTTGPVLLAIHGGGFCGLTWALFSNEITKKIQCRVMAIDMRGHGSTQTTNDEDLSLDLMATDVLAVLETVFKLNTPPIVLIGHSMGGAVAIQVAPLIPTVVGVCVIGISEGPSINSLPLMKWFLKSRPDGFASIENAIKWNVRDGSTFNIEASRVSMPGQIKSTNSGKTAAEEILTATPISEMSNRKNLFSKRGWEPAIAEQASVEDMMNLTLTTDYKMLTKTKEPINYKWRIDLVKTEKFWLGWFEGFSQKFLDIPQPKLLLMANIHELDTCLTIGQMQGKFQFNLLPKCGHVIQEDCPVELAEVVAGYLIKQELAKSLTNIGKIN